MRAVMMQVATDLAQPFEDRVAQVCERVSGVRADLVVLPELWPTGYFAFDDYATTAQPLDGPLRASLGQAARAAGVHLHAGSFVERDDEGRLFNTSLLFTPDGELAHSYRKVHLFGHQSRESQLLTAGADIGAHPAGFGVVALSTCYDLRFPELYRLQVEQGAEVLLVTAAWPAARVEHWRLHTRMRALENQCFLLAANASGSQDGVELAGRSVAVDPWGSILAEAEPDDESLTVDFDPAEVHRFRAEFPSLADRTILLGARAPERTS